MSDLPKGWALAKLSDIVSSTGVVSDGDWVESKDQDVNGSVRLIQLADIGDGFFINKSNRFMNHEKAEKLRCTFLKSGDVLVARMPDPLGRACIFPGIGNDAVTVVDVCLVRLNEDSALSNRLFMHWMNSPVIRSMIDMQASGVTRRRITRKKLALFDFPIPPRNEQIRIANKLDTILAKVDNTQARLDKIPAILKRFRQAVLAAATSGELTDSNFALCEKEKLKEITTKIGSGSTPKGGSKSYKESGIPLVRSQNIHSTFIKYKDLAFIDEDQARKLANVEIEKGDVLLNITGASIGRVNIAPDKFIGGRVNQHVAIIRCMKEKISPKFLHLYLASPEVQKWIEGENYGVTRQALTKGMIEDMIIPIPTLNEQEEIISRIEQLFGYADSIEKQVQEAFEQVDKLTQSILAKAFRGELVPQDPDDEPSERLLEKIQKEKPKSKAKRKK